METKQTNKKLLVFKIIALVVYACLVGLILVEFIPILAQTDVNKQKISLAFFIVLILIIMGGIIAVINTIVSAIGLIVAIKDKARKKSNIIFFVIMTILPLLTEVAFFIATKLMLA